MIHMRRYYTLYVNDEMRIYTRDPYMHTINLTELILASATRRNAGRYFSRVRWDRATLHFIGLAVLRRDRSNLVFRLSRPRRMVLRRQIINRSRDCRLFRTGLDGRPGVSWLQRNCARSHALTAEQNRKTKEKFHEKLRTVDFSQKL